MWKVKRPHIHYDYFPGGQPVWRFMPPVRRAPRAGIRLDPNEIQVLSGIAAGAVTSSSLHKHTGVPLQQCQRALLRLDAMGLIARSRTSGTNERVARLLPAGDAALKGRP